MEYKVQSTFRTCARLVPLSALDASDRLRRLVFVEAPYTLWGMDRLDRAMVDTLPFEAQVSA